MKAGGGLWGTGVAVGCGVSTRTTKPHKRTKHFFLHILYFISPLIFIYSFIHIYCYGKRLNGAGLLRLFRRLQGDVVVFLSPVLAGERA